MRRFAGACRFVFNRALARQNENHEAGNKYIPHLPDTPLRLFTRLDIASLGG